MENQSDAILTEMEETRSSLTDKLEALENRVAGTIQPVADSVEHMADAAKEMVDNVKQTVHGVTDKVEEAVQSVSSSLDLTKHTEQHPWVMFGLAATTGCVLGRLLAPSSSSNGRASSSSAPNYVRQDGNGATARFAATGSAAPARESQKSGLFQEEMQKLKDLALSSLMGVVRDWVRKSVPTELGNRIAAEVDQLTTKLGAQPIAGSVLGE